MELIQPGKVFWASWINIFCSSTVCTSATIPPFGRGYVYFMLTQCVREYTFLWQKMIKGQPDWCYQIWLCFSRLLSCQVFCGGVLVNVFKSSLDVFESSVFSWMYGMEGSGEVILFAKIFDWSDGE